MEQMSIQCNDQPEKHKLGRGCCELASCQVSFNFAQCLQKRSKKCLGHLEARVAILVFPPRRGYWAHASCQVLSYSIWSFLRRNWECLSQSVARVAMVFSEFAPNKKTTNKLGRGLWELASSQVLSNSALQFLRSRKCEKLKADRRRTRCDHNSALEPSAQVC